MRSSKPVDYDQRRNWTPAVDNLEDINDNKWDRKPNHHAYWRHTKIRNQQVLNKVNAVNVIHPLWDNISNRFGC